MMRFLISLATLLLLLKVPIVSSQCAVSPEDISTSLPYLEAASINSGGAGITNLACEVDSTDAGVWYQLTLAQDAITVVTVSEQLFSTSLALFSGDICGTSPTCISNTASYRYSDRTIEWAARAGTTYYLLVKGAATASGSFRISVQALESENDECSKATGVTPSLPYLVAASNTAAVPGFADLTCEVSSDDRGLWYQLTPAEDAIASVLVSDQGFSVRISLYAGTCGSLTCILHTTTSSYSDRFLSWKAEVGTTYYVLVSGNTFADDGQFQVSIQAPTPPANHECSGATDVSVPFAVVESNTLAFPDFSDLSCSVDDTDRGLWYKLAPTENTIAKAVVTNQAFSARISVYSGSCGSLTCIIPTTASSYSDRSIQWIANAGTTYYVLVTGNEFADDGQFQISIEAPTPPANDECSGATDVSSLVPFTTAESNSLSFPGFSDLSCNVDATVRGLWYKLSPVEGVIGVATVSNQAFSARISLYSGTCSSLTCLSSTSVSSYSDRVMQWKAEAGKTYYVLVTGDDFEDDGQFQISIQAPTPPGNHDCSGATDVSSLIPHAIAESTTLAFPDFADLACNVDATDRGLWYQLTPSQDSIAKATVSNQAFSARISLYSGSCGTLTCMSSTSVSSYSDRTMEWAAAAGSTYYVLVTGDEFADDGQFQIAIQAPTPPTNYQCAGATDISSSLPYSVADTNTQAFPDFSDLACNIDSNARGLWYRLEPAENAIVVAKVSNQAFSARLSLHSGACASLTCVSSTSVSSYSDRTIEWAAKAGTSYYLLLSGDDFADDGQFQISVQSLDAPTNDECSGAKDVTFLLPYAASETNTGAFPSFSDLACNVDGSDRGLWYKLTLPETAAGTKVTVSSQGFSAQVSLYTGNCGSLTCIQSTSASSYSDRTITWTATASSTYYMLVSGSDFSADGQFQVSIQTSIVVAPGAPTPQPVPVPVNAPTLTPTKSPVAPVSRPTLVPTKSPVTPVSQPTLAPTKSPVAQPTSPIVQPTQSPVSQPTASPGIPVDSHSPTKTPGASPTAPTLIPVVVDEGSTAPTAIEEIPPSPGTRTVELVPTSLQPRTAPGTPLEIKPEDNVATVNIKEWPQNGSLTIRDDNMIIYTPFARFIGFDSFLVEMCDADGQCAEMAVTVQVGIADDDDGGSSTGLYGLAALGLLPLIVLAVVFRKRLGCGGGGDKSTDQLAQSVNPPNDRGDPYVDQEAVADQYAAAAAQHPHQAPPPPVRPVMAQQIRDYTAPGHGYLPENKDQCRSVAMPGGGNNAEPPMVPAVIADPIFSDQPDQATLSSGQTGHSGQTGQTRQSIDP